MDMQNMDLMGGSLQISTDVIAKIARCAAMEIDGVADVALIVRFGTCVPVMAEKVQKNVKSAVQNMTRVTVSRVNLIVAGLASEAPAAAAE